MFQKCPEGSYKWSCPAFACSKSIIEKIEKGTKYVQSYQ